MECTIHWQPASGMAFMAETGSGHIINMDGAPEGGGRNLAPRPMETVLAGTGGCTAYDVVLILKRGRHDVRGCSVKLTSERADTDPKVFTKIHMHFTVTGKGVPASAVERAIAGTLPLTRVINTWESRWPTNINKPRRQDSSCLLARRCSVNCLMRSVMIAIWTSAEPVSESWR